MAYAIMNKCSTLRSGVSQRYLTRDIIWNTAFTMFGYKYSSWVCEKPANALTTCEIKPSVSEALCTSTPLVQNKNCEEVITITIPTQKFSVSDLSVKMTERTKRTTSLI